MGFLFKFFLFFVLIYLILKGIVNLLLGKRGKQNKTRGSRNYNTRRQPPKQPETQKDRIIDYQRKKFEASDVEDADFVEIKEQGS